MYTGLSAHSNPSDLAVVMGNEVLKDGTASLRLQARLQCAIALYRNHSVRMILVSGGQTYTGFTEADVMARYLIKNGIPARDILLDDKAANTKETANNVALLEQVKHFSGIVIVTQYYHIPRSIFAFRRAALSGLSASYPKYFEWYDILAILREAIALPVYFAKMPNKESMH